MAPQIPTPNLIQIGLTTVVDNFVEYINPYNENFENRFADERPTFGPFGNLKTSILILIIEELIKREKLTLGYLRILLPEDAESLSCDENLEFSPFECKTIELISKRCPNFKVLHFHYGLQRTSGANLAANETLRDSIRRLEHLQEINFYDTCIEKETIKCIALNCPNLRTLNLHRTNLSENYIDALFAERSVLKNSLTKLIIDETYLPMISIEQCLLKLTNLTHFQSDSTIDSALKLFERRNSSELGELPKFKTTICKNKFLGTDESLWTEESVTWLGEKFPKVDHLIFSFQEANNMFVIRLITSMNHITQLELSSWSEGESITFLLPAISSCKNLITLKLENFLNVYIIPLGNGLKKLEKLILVNNTYVRSGKIQFESLKEFQIILFEDNFQSPSLKLNLEYSQMSFELLSSILSSENMERVLLYGQLNFTNELVEDLLERRCLQNLKELKLFRCLLGIDGIYDLLARANSIEDIVVGFCDSISEEDIYQISSYCKINNFAVSITQALENPYYLRWVVQESEVPS